MTRERGELTPEQRAQRARIAAHSLWATCPDRKAATAPARKNSPASTDYWEKKVDPEGKLSPAERAKRVKNAKSAHYRAMALKSSRTRGRGKTTRTTSRRTA